MRNITAVIITKNEEAVIGECLKSLDFIDKILVIDSDSTDNTCQIARKLEAKVVKHPFKDFAETRNFALKLVNTDWLLYIDADERVTPKLQKEIVRATQKGDVQAFSFTRKNYYLGKEWPYKEVVTRLFLKEKLICWQGKLHETPQVKGKVKKIDGELLHFTHRSLEEMLDKTIEWSGVEAKLRLQSGHPKVTWWRLIRVFFTGFINSYIFQKGYKVGAIGFIESFYQGFSMFITYVRLWEMQKNQK